MSVIRTTQQDLNDCVWPSDYLTVGNCQIGILQPISRPHHNKSIISISFIQFTCNEIVNLSVQLCTDSVCNFCYHHQLPLSPPITTQSIAEKTAPKIAQIMTTSPRKTVIQERKKNRNRDKNALDNELRALFIQLYSNDCHFFFKHLIVSPPLLFGYFYPNIWQSIKQIFNMHHVHT